MDLLVDGRLVASLVVNRSHQSVRDMIAASERARLSGKEEGVGCNEVTRVGKKGGRKARYRM